MLIFLFWILCGMVAAIIAGKKGEGCLGFVVGTLLGPFGVLFAILSKGNRKYCPYCKELVHKDAVRCPHCQKELPSTVEDTLPTAPTSFSNQQQIKPAKADTSVLVFLAIVGLIVIIAFWKTMLPLSIAGIGIWFVWKKYPLKTWLRFLISGAILFAVITYFVSYQHFFPTPVLTITSPANESTTSSTVVRIEGMVSPQGSTVKIDNQITTIDNNGKFTFDTNLTSTTTDVKIIANYRGTETSQTLTLHKTPNTQETTMSAKELAEQKKWEQSKAGQLCKKHPEWTKDDCQGVVGNKIWIGMDLNMLKAERGTPHSANQSNYGSGTQWQWCWNDDYTPSCFYGGNDGIVTSYN